MPVSDAGGVYRSLDGGATWTASSGLFSATVYGLTRRPDGAGDGVRRECRRRPEVDRRRRHVRRDRSAHDRRAGGGTPSTIGEVHSLVIDATDPAILVAGTHQGGGVFRSTNGGATWTHTSTGLFSEFGNWRFVNVIAQDPVSPAVFYASTTRETYRSHDGGVTWAPFDTGLSRGEAYAFGVHASGRVYYRFGLRRVPQPPGSTVGREPLPLLSGEGQGIRPAADRDGRPFRDRGYARSRAGPLLRADRSGRRRRGRLDRAPRLLQDREGGLPSTRCVVPVATDRRLSRLPGVPPRDRLRARDGRRVPSPPHDAYRCLAGGHWKSFPIDLTLSDPIGSQLIRQHRTDRLCVPTDLDGAGENRIEPDVDLRCDGSAGQAPTVRPYDRHHDRPLRHAHVDADQAGFALLPGSSRAATQRRSLKSPIRWAGQGDDQSRTSSRIAAEIRALTFCLRICAGPREASMAEGARRRPDSRSSR